MRYFVRLLILFREIENNDSVNLSQFFRFSKFDVIVKCVMQIFKFDVKRGEKEVRIFFLVLYIGYLWKKCVVVVYGKVFREKDKGVLEDVEYFEKLMEVEWNYRVSYYFVIILNDRKYNQFDFLFFISDFQKLKEFIILKIIVFIT